MFTSGRPGFSTPCGKEPALRREGVGQIGRAWDSRFAELGSQVGKQGASERPAPQNLNAFPQERDGAKILWILGPSLLVARWHYASFGFYSHVC